MRSAVLAFALVALAGEVYGPAKIGSILNRSLPVPTCGPHMPGCNPAPCPCGCACALTNLVGPMLPWPTPPPPDNAIR